ncbi:phospholipase D-like domain-containing protein [Methyloterricola oryzae]|uniref:phospholipase D-like domain-containing protein n=1 Tax=Methyloterricola oryzae TaxID=1495050 RepID=UPI0005EB9BBF|nr:phospholipase D-like domain-containing protein [Methyloterricola oryzae]
MLFLMLLAQAFPGIATATNATQPGIDTSVRRQSALDLRALTVLPDDGRDLYFQAFDAAKREIRIEICVLEDPQILARLRSALARGVRVRVIADRGKYEALESERTNLEQQVTSLGGELHLSNPQFPRSFPKVILIDAKRVVYGSACLDETTFKQYRDFAHVSSQTKLIRNLERLFENDWLYSAEVGHEPPPFNPTPRISKRNLLVSPVNSAKQLVELYQKARKSLDVYTELLGNQVLESELAAAAQRGVAVRLIAPVKVNGATDEVQDLQTKSLSALAATGVAVHVSGPEESADLPYMHARAAVVDGREAYLGSISLSPSSLGSNREVGVILRQVTVVRQLKNQFESDYQTRTRKF